MLSFSGMWNFLHEPFFGPAVSGLGFGAAVISVIFLIIALWALVWKALALWHAARNRQRIWFIVLLLVNTVGILEIVYLAWFAKDARDTNSEELFPFLKDIRAKAGMMSSSAPEKETVVKVVEKSGPDVVE
jgi:hypothetical protein